MLTQQISTVFIKELSICTEKFSSNIKYILFKMGDNSFLPTFGGISIPNQYNVPSIGVYSSNIPVPNQAEDLYSKCEQFRENPAINPFTGRRIGINGPTYEKLLNQCGQPYNSQQIRQPNEDLYFSEQFAHNYLHNDSEEWMNLTQQIEDAVMTMVLAGHVNSDQVRNTFNAIYDRIFN